MKDLGSGEILDQIPNVWNGTAWADDNRTFFYMTADSAKRGNAVWRHVIGTPRDQDEKVYQEDNVLFNVGVNRSKSGKYVFISSDGFTSSETRFIPTATPTAPSRVVAERREGVEYTVDHAPGMFLIYTNDGATNFRIVRAPENDPSRHNWSDWLPERPTVFVEGLDVFKNYIVVTERADGLRRFRVSDPSGARSHYITFPEQAYGVFAAANPEIDSELFRFSYSSLVTPSSVYDYNLRTRQRELRKRQEIPSGYDATRYEVRRLMAPARDGVRVPVSVLVRHGVKLDGRNPLLLYAYGSYGATTEPTFNSAVLSLVDRGFVYAIAHIRGGQEMGRKWYDDGKMMKKLNTFYDFIDVAQELVRLNIHQSRSTGGQWRQRRRAPDGRGGQHEARLVPGYRGRRALCGRHQYDGRRVAAAHRPGVGAVGQPGNRGPVPLHDAILALRQRGREGVPVDAGHHLVQRFAGDVLGTGKVGGPAAGDQDRQQSPDLQDQHGRRPWRFLGSLRPTQGNGVPVRLHA